MHLRAAGHADRSWIQQTLTEEWGDYRVVVRGVLMDSLVLPAVIVEEDGRPCGLMTYEARGVEWEIVTLNALTPQRGMGTAMVEHLAERARRAGAQRLVVETSNDNMNALRFYQRRGFELTRVRPGALVEARRLKPALPMTGTFGIPLRDEIQLVRPL
ncbi:MAG: GNAT family N-acetyltransferase [Phycisphaerae bacterium]